MAHEVAVHRWDAQTAVGAPQPIDRELAVDGIQEAFDIMPARLAANPPSGAGETIHLHCTDGEGEWLLRLTPDGVVVTREHAKGDVAAAGPRRICCCSSGAGSNPTRSTCSATPRCSRAGRT